MLFQLNIEIFVVRGKYDTFSLLFRYDLFDFWVVLEFYFYVKILYMVCAMHAI